MTDEPELPDQEPASPESDAVRRLLADARHDAPMPPDVVARMDRVLADLAATSTTVSPGEVVPAEATPDEGVVTRLPAQRRRRAATLLVAAAAIVVAGVVFAQHRPSDGGSAATAGGAAAPESADRFAGESGGTASLAPSDSAGGNASKAAPAKLRDGRVVVRRTSFAEDALGGQALLAKHPHVREAPFAAPTPSCAPLTGSEQALAADYEGAPAVLVYHAPHGSTQVVDLVVCGGGGKVLTVTLPAP